MLLLASSSFLVSLQPPSSVLPDSYQILIESSDVEIRLPEEQVICPSVSLRAEIVSLDLTADMQIRMVAWDPVGVWALRGNGI